VFNYVSVDFPLAETPPQRISTFYIDLTRYAHETATLRFRDWDVRFSHIRPGEPVRCTLRGINGAREFVGYIHDIKPDISPGKQFVEISLIGASYKMKQARQRVLSNITASEAIKTIAKPYGFNLVVEDHPRFYSQIAQAGHTDLEIMTRIAKQSGYTLRIENTTLYFQSLTSEYSISRANAPTFVMREANDPKGSTLYSFNLTLGESVMYPDAYKSAAQVGGVDPYSIQPVTKTNPVRPEVLNQNSTAEFFDSFATNVVAPGASIAAHEAYAIDQRNRFPYRARVEVQGTPNLTPDKPVFLAGIGSDYTGYWIILSVRHQVREESPNIYKYTTLLEVGTDSIGSANIWNDGKLIQIPDTVQARYLVQDKKNEPSNVTSVLTTGSDLYANYIGETNNRPQAVTGKVPSVWVASGNTNSNADYLVAQSNLTEASANRLGLIGV